MRWRTAARGGMAMAMACASLGTPSRAQESSAVLHATVADAQRWWRAGRADSAVRVLAGVAPSARSGAAEVTRALALYALGRRYAADSAVRRAVLFGVDSAPAEAPPELVAAWRAARLRVPRADSLTATTGDGGVHLSVRVTARDGSAPRGRAAWWLTGAMATDTVCVGAVDVPCVWNGRVADDRASAGMARVGVSITTGDLDLPLVAARAVRVTWEVPALPPEPAILPETVTVVLPDLERRAVWWRRAAVAGGVGGVAMSIIAAKAGTWSVDTPADAPVRRIGAAVYIAGGVTLLAAAGAAAWSAVRPWTRTSRFARPDVVAANAERRAAWSRAVASAAASGTRLVLVFEP
jgi:hypothetical protein